MNSWWYDEGIIKYPGGFMEQTIHAEIQYLRDQQYTITHNKKNYYNWELTFNRIELIIDKLYKEADVVRILES